MVFLRSNSKEQPAIFLLFCRAALTLLPPITQKVPPTFELRSIKIKLLSTAGRVWGGAEGLGFAEAEVSTKKYEGR